MKPSSIDWDSFFARYRVMALRCAVGWSDSTTAEDLVQEAAQAVLERARRPPPFETAAHARNYLFRTLHNRAVECLRRPGRHALSLDEARARAAPVPDPLEAAAEAEESDRTSGQLRAIARLVGQLRPEERLAIQLRYRDGLTLREMSERTGTPISTLGERVQAGLGKIRQKAGRTGTLPRS